MKSIISFRLAGNILLFLLVLLSLFHILVLSGLIPDEIVWAGTASQRGKSATFTLEFIALAVTLLFLFIILIKTRYLKSKYLYLATDFLTWIIFAYFLLNAVANFLSEAKMETYIFGPLALILSFLSFRLAIEKTPVKSAE